MIVKFYVLDFHHDGHDGERKKGQLLDVIHDDGDDHYMFFFFV